MPNRKILFAVLILQAILIFACNDDKSTNPSTNIDLNPFIASIDPNIGCEGDEVEITGSEFGKIQAAGKVSFNGSDVIDYLSWSDSLVVVKVPRGTFTGELSLTASGTESNKVVFTMDWSEYFKLGINNYWTYDDMLIDGTTEIPFGADKKAIILRQETFLEEEGFYISLQRSNGVEFGRTYYRYQEYEFYKTTNEYLLGPIFKNSMIGAVKLEDGWVKEADFSQPEWIGYETEFDTLNVMEGVDFSGRFKITGRRDNDTIKSINNMEIPCIQIIEACNLAGNLVVDGEEKAIDYTFTVRSVWGKNVGWMGHYFEYPAHDDWGWGDKPFGAIMSDVKTYHLE